LEKTLNILNKGKAISMKKFLFLIFIFLNVSFTFSQTYYLNVNLKNGAKVAYKVANIDKINFSDIASGFEDIQKYTHIVKSFKLMQNYPNPFNPSTTIHYEIPKAGEIEISIFNMNGRLIKNIVNQNQQAGTHKVVWNGINKTGNKVSSGLYIYTVRFEDTISSKKMILLK